MYVYASSFGKMSGHHKVTRRINSVTEDGPSLWPMMDSWSLCSDVWLDDVTVLSADPRWIYRRLRERAAGKPLKSTSAAVSPDHWMEQSIQETMDNLKGTKSFITELQTSRHQHERDASKLIRLFFGSILMFCIWLCRMQPARLR